MFVQNHLKIIVKSGLHNPIELPEPLVAELMIGVHVLEGLQVDTNGLESALPDESEMAFLKAGAAKSVPERIVAEDIDSASHFRYLIEWIKGREIPAPPYPSSQSKGRVREPLDRLNHYLPDHFEFKDDNNYCLS